MKISEVIEELQERLKSGDDDMIFRACDDDTDYDIIYMYYDDEAERLVLHD